MGTDKDGVLTVVFVFLLFFFFLGGAGDDGEGCLGMRLQPDLGWGSGDDLDLMVHLPNSFDTETCLNKRIIVTKRHGGRRGTRVSYVVVEGK